MELSFDLFRNFHVSIGVIPDFTQNWINARCSLRSADVVIFVLLFFPMQLIPIFELRDCCLTYDVKTSRISSFVQIFVRRHVIFQEAYNSLNRNANRINYYFDILQTFKIQTDPQSNISVYKMMITGLILMETE